MSFTFQTCGEGLFGENPSKSKIYRGKSVVNRCMNGEAFSDTPWMIEVTYVSFFWQSYGLFAGSVALYNPLVRGFNVQIFLKTTLLKEFEISRQQIEDMEAGS